MINDVKTFMHGVDQIVTQHNNRQLALYIGLQLEEVAEKLASIFSHDHMLVAEINRYGDAFKKGQFDSALLGLDMVPLLDADLDLIWVSIGAAISTGANVQKGWDMVRENNMAKIDPATGKARRDQNGKVMKPPGHKPPDLLQAFQG